MNLFSDDNKRKINLALFTDERKNILDTWNYICTIIIPTNYFNDIHDVLLEHRNKVGYHNELKFCEIGQSGPKLELAKLWLNEVLNDKSKKIYFKILGLDSKLFNANTFGEGSIKKGANYANLYNRFFRTNVLSVKHYFNDYDEIIIDRIFHDSEGNLENHPLFSWHCIWKLNDEDNKIKTNYKQIVFVNSNHHEEVNHPKVSHIIQLSDILIGTVSHCLDFEKPKHKGRNELGILMYPLLKRILNNPMNKNSSFKYYKKYDIKFFPKSVPEQYSNLKQYLHSNRQIKIYPYISKIENAKNGIEELW